MILFRSSTYVFQCPAFEIPVSEEDDDSSPSSSSSSAGAGEGVSPPPPHSCAKVKCMFSVDFNATSDNQGKKREHHFQTSHNFPGLNS